jgi:hypothetical protein
MDTCDASSNTDDFSCRLREHPAFKTSRSFLNLSLVPSRAGKRPQTMTCLPHAQMTEQAPDDIFALFLQKANEVVVGKVRVGHSMVSMPSSYPAFHLLETFGSMPSGSVIVPGGNAREFAHVHATFLHDDNPAVVAKKRRGMSSLSATLEVKFGFLYVDSHMNHLTETKLKPQTSFLFLSIDPFCPTLVAHSSHLSYSSPSTPLR